MNVVVNIIDWILFVPLTLCVGYLLFFSIASRYPARLITDKFKTKVHRRFLVLFPAYAEDRVILNSVSEFLKQDYPSDYYEVVVISDHMKAETDEALRDMGARVLVADYVNSSKAKALAHAMMSTPPGANDAVIVMDADNTTVPHFLARINQILAQGYLVLQAHRTSKNPTTAIALLDAASEEINNGIFRKGHNVFWFSAALSGSGMVIEEDHFRRYAMKMRTAGEDKELEAMILRERIGPVVYIDDLPVYDEKTQKQKAISNQRRRWIAAQYGALRASLPHLPKAIKLRHWDYCNKIFQWMLPPRLVQLAAVFGFTVLFTCIHPLMGIKWWILSAAQVAAMIVPLPREMMTWRLLKALMRVPFLALIMIGNLFRLKGANKKFIHTEHGTTS